MPTTRPFSTSCGSNLAITNSFPSCLPIGQQADFRGVANALTQKAYLGDGAERSDLPEEYADALEEAHMELMEAAAEADDELLEKYFEEESLSFDEIRDGMRKASRSPELKTAFPSSRLQPRKTSARSRSWKR